MNREQRIELALNVLTQKESRDAFRRCAFIFPELSVFWHEDLNFVELVGDHVTIEFRDL